METTLPLTTIRRTLPLATPQRLTPTGKSGRTDEAPRDPRRGASPRYAPTSRRPPDDLRAPQLDFSPWLFASSAVPLTCPRWRLATVTDGQQRSAVRTAELRRRWLVGGPTELPKLAFLQGEDRPCRARPANPVPSAVACNLCPVARFSPPPPRRQARRYRIGIAPTLWASRLATM
jgi:hypothetical protein